MHLADSLVEKTVFFHFIFENLKYLDYMPYYMMLLTFLVRYSQNTRLVFFDYLRNKDMIAWSRRLNIVLSFRKTLTASHFQSGQFLDRYCLDFGRIFK